MNSSINRVPPHSEQAERGVIGSILLDPDRVIYLCQQSEVNEDWFYSPANRLMFRAINDMNRIGRGIDLLTVCETLKANGTIEKCGGEANVESVVESTPTSAHAEHYLKIVKDCWLKRRVIDASTEFIEASYHGNVKSTDIISHGCARMLEMLDEKKERSNEQIKKQSIEHWKTAMAGGVSGIPSPWPKFNERFGGLHDGIVTLFGGKAGTGKSSASATWLHFLGTKGIPVACLPFEDGADKTWQRIAGIHGDFSVFNLDVGKSNDEAISRAESALGSVMKMPVYLEDRPMNVDAISAWATRMVAKFGVRVIFIDAFKDIVRGSRDTESDDAQSQAICNTARRLRIPILVFHHVRKGDIKDGSGGKLTQDDIRGSGQIVSDCRQLILLQAVYSKQSGEIEYAFEIAKNNYGPTGYFPMERISNRCKWIEKPDLHTDSMGRLVSR